MILWRYILRALIAPFLFSNTVIIFLFLLQFLMKSAKDIIGKGLSIWVIIEATSLNLAWMVVLAVPMSVLVASLMAFGKMASENETTIMRASGMSLYRMMAPALAFAALLAVGLVYFNNAILPESNIRLSTLMGDILRKKPTLSLQAGVFTAEEQIPSYRILVRKTYEKSSDLEGVTIYDLSKPDKNIVVTAEHGKVSFSKDFSKIFMDLRKGEIHELDESKPGKYRKLRFERHRVSIPASGFGFERTDASKAHRDDRTMSANMMMNLVDSIGKAKLTKDTMLTRRVRADIDRYYTAMAPIPPPRQRDPFTGAFEEPKQAPIGSVFNRDSLRAIADTVIVFSAQDSIHAAARAAGNIRQTQAFAQGDIGAINYDLNEMDKYLVEVHKKYSIPVACIVFVLIGVPLGMMARRGGFGVGAGLSLGFFLFYWACLIGGEKLADRHILTPFWGMWVANIILGAMGVVLTLRSAKESTVIDWSKLSRFIPKFLRTAENGSVPGGGAHA